MSDESTDPILAAASSDGNYGTTDSHGMRHCDMFPPGKILFFEQSMCDDRIPVNVTEQDVSELAEIRVTPSWIMDHMPAAYLKTLHYSMTQQGETI